MDLLKQKMIEPNTPASHGGERKGAGRPSMDLRAVAVGLSDEDIERAKKLGAGKVAAGIRVALAAATGGQTLPV